jgi:hypothetical protein
LAGKVFRIGHLGDFNDLMLAGTLSGVEMGLALAGVPHSSGGVAVALEYLTERGAVASAAGGAGNSVASYLGAPFCANERPFIVGLLRARHEITMRNQEITLPF